MSVTEPKQSWLTFSKRSTRFTPSSELFSNSSQPARPTGQLANALSWRTCTKGACDDCKYSTIRCRCPSSDASLNIACWGLPRLLAAHRRTHVFLGCDLSYRNPISAPAHDRLSSARSRSTELRSPTRLPPARSGYCGIWSNLNREIRARCARSYHRWRLSAYRRIRLEFLVAPTDQGLVVPELRVTSNSCSGIDRTRYESRQVNCVRFKPSAICRTQTTGKLSRRRSD